MPTPGSPEAEPPLADGPCPHGSRRPGPAAGRRARSRRRSPVWPVAAAGGRVAPSCGEAAPAPPGWAGGPSLPITAGTGWRH